MRARTACILSSSKTLGKSAVSGFLHISPLSTCFPLRFNLPKYFAPTLVPHILFATHAAAATAGEFIHGNPMNTYGSFDLDLLLYIFFFLFFFAIQQQEQNAQESIIMK